MTASNRPLQIRAALLDFDGTVVREDVTTLLAGLNGRLEESHALNEEFRSGRLPGIVGLVKRTEMLAGITLQQIDELLRADDYLMPGASELFAWFKQNKILTILASGSMLPVLAHYQQLLSIDHIVGTHVLVENDVVRGIDQRNYPLDGFKLTKCTQLLAQHNIAIDECVAIGDSSADRDLLLHAGLAIAINPVGGIEDIADHVVFNDLSAVAGFIESAQRGAH